MLNKRRKADWHLKVVDVVQQDKDKSLICYYHSEGKVTHWVQTSELIMWDTHGTEDINRGVR